MAFNQHWTIGRGLEFSPPDPKNPKGNGKGKGGGFGGGWGKGGKKGGGLIYPAAMNRNVVFAFKSAQSGIVNDPIATWGTSLINDGSAFNETTGVYTAPVTGDYFVMWNGRDDGLSTAVSETKAPIRLRKNGTTTIDETYAAMGAGASTPTHQHSAAMHRIVSLTAGDTLELLQISDEAEFVNWVVCGLYSAYWFEATKATGTGTGSGDEDIVSFDTHTELTTNFSGQFNETTGVWTCPEAGRYFFYGSGGNQRIAVDHLTYIQAIRVAGNVTVGNYHYSVSKTGSTGGPCSLVVELAAGDTVKMRQNDETKNDVVFGGFMLHPNAKWFMLNDWGGTGSTLTDATPGLYTNYTGFATREGSNIGTDWNDSTGVFSVPSGAQTHWLLTGGQMMNGADYLSQQTRLSTGAGGHCGFCWDSTSSTSTNAINRTAYAVGGRSITPGTDTFKMQVASSNASDTPRFGMFCGFEPWGADL